MGFQETFKALSDPTRRDILNLLKKGALPAGEIVAQFKMSGATISHHLSLLKNAGLISDHKKGKYIFYQLNMSVLEEIMAWFATFKEDDDYENHQT